MYGLKKTNLYYPFIKLKTVWPPGYRKPGSLTLLVGCNPTLNIGIHALCNLYMKSSLPKRNKQRSLHKYVHMHVLQLGDKWPRAVWCLRKRRVRVTRSMTHTDAVTWSLSTQVRTPRRKVGGSKLESTQGRWIRHVY